jgi:hypothetical protein
MRSTSGNNLPVIAIVMFSLRFTTEVLALHDDFNDTAIDPATWQVSTPFPSSQVTEGNGRVIFVQRGGINTIATFPSGLEVSGRFKFTGTSDDFGIIIRSDLSFLDTTYYERQGIAIGFSQLNNNVNMGAIGQGVLLGIVSHTFTNNVDTDFRIVDDGFQIRLYLNNSPNPILTRSSTFRKGYKCAIYNREANGTRVELDFITIEGTSEEEFLPAWTHVGSACTVDEDSLGKFEFVNADFKFKGTNVSPPSVGGLLPITARCNVVNPLDAENPDWNRLVVGYQDSNGTNGQNGAIVRLKRINRPGGSLATIATFNSDSFSSINRAEASIPFNHAWDFLRNEYFIQIELYRGNTNNQISVYSLRLVHAEPVSNP